MIIKAPTKCCCTLPGIPRVTNGIRLEAQTALLPAQELLPNNLPLPKFSGCLEVLLLHHRRNAAVGPNPGDSTKVPRIEDFSISLNKSNILPSFPIYFFF